MTTGREAERPLQTLIEGMPQLVWRGVEAEGWTWASPQWIAFTGLSQTESLGFGWLAALHPDDRSQAEVLWREAKASDRLELEHRILKADGGGYRWFQSRAMPVRDDGGAVIEWLGTSTDVDDLRRLQSHQEMLAAELQHRVRNMLTVVRSVFSRTVEAGGDIEEIASHFRGRLDALARAQVIVAKSIEGVVDLEELIRDELLSAGVSDGPKLRIDGPDVRLPSGAAELIGLAFHELTTNAVKYGALKNGQGRVAIQWRVNPCYGDAPRLNLLWKETGVPMVAIAPAREGFGRELIEEALPYRLGAETKLEFRGGGVRCDISLPLQDHSPTLLQVVK